MSIETLMYWALGLLVAGLGILLGLLVIKAVARVQQSAPASEQSILQIMRNYAADGVAAAERLALKSLQETDTLMSGLDQSKIAVAFYDDLPPVLDVFGKLVPLTLVKQIMSRDQFAALVEDVYKAGAVATSKIESYLQKQSSTNAPVGSVYDLPTIQQPYTGGSLTEAPLPSTIASSTPVVANQLKGIDQVPVVALTTSSAPLPTLATVASAGLNASNGTA